MKRLTILISILVTVSCASSYQSKDRGWIFTSVDGFNETQLSENVYSVRFKGNSSTDRTRVDDFTFLRCAELTIENGYRYFTVQSKTEETDSRIYGGVGTYAGNVSGTISNYNYPEAQKTIKMFKEKPQEEHFDAVFLRKSITGKYEME